MSARPELGTTRVAHAAGRPMGAAHAGRGLEGKQRSPYGRPVIKPPVWTWEIPMYFYTGGLGGAAAGLAYGADLSGNQPLARRGWTVAAAATAVSPVLLISDLGKPARFLNMLRVMKVTSPMSVGSWLLSLVAPACATAALNGWTGRLGAPARAARPAAAALGMPLATYTAALVANTAVPVWHDARRLLPFVFGASAAASAGAALTALTPAEHAAPARRAAVAGGALELALTQTMERTLGELGEPYHKGAAGWLGRAAKVLSAGGAALIAARGRGSRAAAVGGGLAMTAGAVCERWSVFRAGFQSAATPDHTVAPQRERIQAGGTAGAVRARPRSAGGDASGSPAVGV